VPTHARRGFTLLEAAVALTIVSLTAVGALAAIAAELRTADRARHLVEAESLATQRLGTIELLALGEPAALPDSLAHGTFAPPLDDYRWAASERLVLGAGELVDLTVQIAWPDGAYRLTKRLYRPSAAEEPAL
jgi:prepilin-type N-terminal cleavage/methylation domain-containing protein